MAKENIEIYISKVNILFRFSTDVEKALREICMIATLEALCIICLAEYYSMMVRKKNFISY